MLAVLAAPPSAAGDGTAEQRGTIVGRINVAKDKLYSERLSVQRDSDICGDTRIIEWAGGTEGGLRDAVVYVTDADDDRRPAERADAVEIGQKGCRFAPRVSIARSGDFLRPANGDPIMHNIHVAEIIGRGRRKIHNVGQEAGDSPVELPVSLRRGWAVKLSCGIHDFMHAWVFFASNPYYDLSDETGRFRIDNVPAGEHKILIWHGWLGKMHIDVDVLAGGEVGVELFFEAE